jgi:hypothetical protein
MRAALSYDGCAARLGSARRQMLTRLLATGLRHRLRRRCAGGRQQERH